MKSYHFGKLEDFSFKEQKLGEFWLDKNVQYYYWYYTRADVFPEQGKQYTVYLLAKCSFDMGTSFAKTIQWTWNSAIIVIAQLFRTFIPLFL